MSYDQLAKVTRFANQIAKNFVALGHDKAVLATADHMDKFWDPRMKAAIFEGSRDGLDPVAAAAVEKLLDGLDPAPQTRATEFADAEEVGGSDAG